MSAPAVERTWTPPLRRATVLVYLATVLLLLLFPVSLSNWLEDKDYSTAPVIRSLLPAVDALAALGPAGWNAAIREKAKGFMRRSE